MPAVTIKADLARILECKAQWDAAELGKLVAARYGVDRAENAASQEALGFLAQRLGNLIGKTSIDIDMHAEGAARHAVQFGRNAARAVGFGFVEPEELATYVDQHIEIQKDIDARGRTSKDLPSRRWERKVYELLHLVALRILVDFHRRKLLPGTRPPADPRVR